MSDTIRDSTVNLQIYANRKKKTKISYIQCNKSLVRLKQSIFQNAAHTNLMAYQTKMKQREKKNNFFVPRIQIYILCDDLRIRNIQIQFSVYMAKSVGFGKIETLAHIYRQKTQVWLLSRILKKEKMATKYDEAGEKW